MKLRATVLAFLLVVSLVGMATAPAAVGATEQQADGEAYAGTNVEFETTENAVLDYAVNDNVIVENATMTSSEEARTQTGIGASAGLETAAGVSGGAISSVTEARASVTIGFESGGEIRSHDNQRGVAQFEATDEDQFVQVDVSGNSEADAESDSRVVVDSGDGPQGVFIVVGDGEVAVNEEGNVNAEIQEGSQLVYRQYDDERSENDQKAERMIEEGTAAAEVYVKSAADDTDETTADVVHYGEDTTVEVLTESENTIEMTAERSESDGKVLLTSVEETAFESAENIEVFVDGEAATRANSYSEVEQSAIEGDESRFLVRQSASADATTDVAIGIDGFSERNVEMTTDDGTDTGGDDGATTDGDGAGFGMIVAILALVGTLFAARRY